MWTFLFISWDKRVLTHINVVFRLYPSPSLISDTMDHFSQLQSRSSTRLREGDDSLQHVLRNFCGATQIAHLVSHFKPT